MQRQPLRLGSSTSGLTRAFGEDTSNLLSKGQDLTSEEAQLLRSSLQAYARQTADSQVQSLEYFIGLPMLEIGLKSPLMDFLKNLGENCEIWSVHAPFGGVDLASTDEVMRRQSIAYTNRAADIASALGAKVMTVHPGLELPDLEDVREIRIQASGKSIAEVADHAATMGITVAVEDLPRKCIGNSWSELYKILELADRPNVGFCLDVNHTFPASNLPNVVREIGPNIVTLHISDHDDVDERHWLPMLGIIDWPAFIGSLKEVGYTGPFMYEVPLKFDSYSEGIAALEENYNKLMASA